jgi:hypothetical protein
MKKLIAVLLSFSMIVTMFAFTGSAESNEVTDYPVVIVAGYSSSQLYDADTGEHAGRTVTSQAHKVCRFRITFCKVANIRLAMANCFGTKRSPL